MQKNISKMIILLSVFAFSLNLSAQSIIVNTSNLKQTIDMIGGDMERSSIAIQSAQNKQEIIDWSFKDINFNVCRVQYDKNQEMVEGTKNWAFYTKQVATMQAIKHANPDIKFFATLRSDYDGYGDDNNLPDWIVNYNTKVMQTDKYAIFLADYLEHMSDNGVPIYIMSTSKEWMWHVRPDKVPDILSKMYSELDARGIQRPLISDQGFWSISQGITYLNSVKSLGTKDLYHSFCSHNYANESAEKWVEIIEKSKALGKPMYDDETSTGSGSPTYGVERAMFKQIGEYIKKANRYKAGLSGEIFFEIWSRGIDKETRSIYFPSKGTGTRLRGYYLMKHFSNNILDSRYVTSEIAGMPNVYTISFRKGNQVVLWVINKGTSGYMHFPIGVDAFEIDGKVDLHFWSDNTPITGSEMTHQALGNRFETSIAGEGINCYIFNVKDKADNLALSGTASQSSTANNGFAELAIDGNSDGVFDNGSVSLTNSEVNPWWQVDLGKNDTIGIIKVYNRTDECCNALLSDFTVSVIDSENNVVFTKTISEAPDSCISLDAEGARGQIVKVQSNGTTSLSLAEVQVFKGSLFQKLEQSIEFSAFPTLRYREVPITLTAKSESGLPITYTSSNTDVAEVVNGALQLKSIGSATITASIGESALYKAADDVSREVNVTKAYQIIFFAALPAKRVGDPSFLPGATSSSGLTVEYSSSNLDVATIDNNRIVIVGEGTSTITAFHPGNDLYDEASRTQLLTVDKAFSGTIDTTTVTLLPMHDAYVRGGTSGNDNYGTEAELLIKQTTNKDFQRKTYVKFDVEDVLKVHKATLRLYAKSSSASQIAVYVTADSWTEQALTYNNAPTAGASLGSQSVASAGKYYDWDVTDYVKSQAETDNLVSFLVDDISANKNNISFYSKEAGINVPQLVVTKLDYLNSIRQADESPVFSIYPNPAEGFVNVISENSIEHISVTSISGQLILTMNSIGKRECKVSLDEFEKGVFLFHISDSMGNENTLKVLVK